MKSYLNFDVLNLDRPNYALLWFFHVKAMETTLDEFYQYISKLILGEREFYAEILKPVAFNLGIKKGVKADVFYQRLRAQRIPPPSEIMAKEKASENSVSADLSAV